MGECVLLTRHFSAGFLVGLSTALAMRNIFSHIHLYDFQKLFSRDHSCAQTFKMWRVDLAIDQYHTFFL